MRRFGILGVGLSVCCVLALSSAGYAGLVDITNTGDAVIGFNANGDGADWPGGEAPPNAINNGPEKYLNLGTTGSGGGSGTGGVTGFKVTPSGSAFAGTSASWSTAPVIGLRLRTANDSPNRDPASYVLEGSNDGTTWTAIASGSTGLNGSQARNTWQAPLTFSNATAWAQYRVGFPTTAGVDNSMQISEVEVLTWDRAVFNGSMNLTAGATATGYPNDGNWPGNESPPNAVDNDSTTKYLHRGSPVTGLDIVPDAALGQTIAKWIGLTSANDAAERDPLSYVLLGSNDAGATYQQIAAGAVPPFNARYDDVYIDISGNITPYDQYRLVFPDVNSDLMQIAEVKLLGDRVPEPVTLALLGLGGAALAGYIRRRKHA